MYKVENVMADQIAKRVISWNLWVVFLAIAVEIIAVMYIDDKVLIAVISGAIGSFTTALLQERQQVINFFFGSSQGSKDKDRSKG
jgi:nicotinamide riboside transporter PnuC